MDEIDVEKFKEMQNDKDGSTLVLASKVEQSLKLIAEEPSDPKPITMPQEDTRSDSKLDVSPSSNQDKISHFPLSISQNHQSDEQIWNQTSKIQNKMEMNEESKANPQTADQSTDQNEESKIDSQSHISDSIPQTQNKIQIEQTQQPTQSTNLGLKRYLAFL